eukprot:TRINITY_DN17389_c0_g1_i3.p1 TRINITY_DN17389_c0_g1~~TRINITY_DN17389_c0_g1_i3.p1  ORF type:complete len:303 (-),score=112.36 TRINITY_DN17389_c0_g1_i3:145-1053(-)
MCIRDRNQVKPGKQSLTETQPLAKSGMQNKNKDSKTIAPKKEAPKQAAAKAEPKKAEEPKKAAAQPKVAEAEPAEAGPKNAAANASEAEAARTPEKQVGAEAAVGTPKCLDAWFQRQRRELSTITDELPQPEESCDLSFMSMNESFSQDAPTTQMCDAASTFDMWLERQKKHLGTLNEQVSDLGSPAELEQFKQLQANKSNESLEQWKEKLAAGSGKASKTQEEKRAAFERDAAYKIQVQELERAAEKVEGDFDRMHELAEKNQILEEASQSEKLWNLTEQMQDSIHGLSPMTPKKGSRDSE